MVLFSTLKFEEFLKEVTAVGISLNGLSGSGLDVEALVQNLIQLDSKPLILMKKRQNLLELKKSLFSEINTSLLSLNSKVESLYKDLTFKPLKIVSSNDDVVRVSAKEDALLSSYRLKITQLATAKSISSTDALDGDPNNQEPARVVSFEKVNDPGGIDPTKKFSAAGFEADKSINSGNITINGVNFYIDVDNTTVDQFMSEVNGDPTAGVKITYDEVNDQFVFETKDDGSDASMALSDETGFFAAAKISPGTYHGSGTIDLDAKLNTSGLSNLNPVGDTIYFKINDYAFSFDVTQHSLNDVLEKINSSNAGVTAFYDGETDKIFISNKATGDATFKFEDVQGTFMDAIKISGATATPAQQAKFSLNDVEMVRDANSFEINGTTFNLLQADGATATVTIERDVDAIYNSIKEFVDFYNSTINLLNTRLSEDPVEDATTDALLSKGLLRGDSTLVNLRSQLRDIIIRPISGLVNVYNSFRDIGITTTAEDYGKSGLLEIDEDKLRTAIENNAEAVEKLFLDDLDGDEKVDEGEQGLAGELYTKLQSYISTNTISVGGRTFKEGILAMRTDGIQREIENYDDQIESFVMKLEKNEERYWAKFTAMEVALSKLNNQSNWLMGQIATLPSGLF